MNIANVYKTDSSVIVTLYILTYIFIFIYIIIRDSKIIIKYVHILSVSNRDNIVWIFNAEQIVTLRFLRFFPLQYKVRVVYD